MFLTEKLVKILADVFGIVQEQLHKYICNSQVKRYSTFKITLARLKLRHCMWKPNNPKLIYLSFQN
jgi:hypothetical protein